MEQRHFDHPPIPANFLIVYILYPLFIFEHEQWLICCFWSLPLEWDGPTVIKSKMATITTTGKLVGLHFVSSF